MARRPRLPKRLLATVLWPFGVTLTSWNYMWRTTPFHRREDAGSLADDCAPPLPEGLSLDRLQAASDGVGDLFRRRYRACIRDTDISAEEMIATIGSDLNAVVPTEFARFRKIAGADHDLAVGDEFVVRMPGPWNGPVRVVASGPTMFRLATLDGHLEAGQIEFRAARAADDLLEFTVESWARSGDRVSRVLYQHVRIAKEVQLHMWTSLLERVARLAGGRITGGIDIDTRRVELR